MGVPFPSLEEEEERQRQEEEKAKQMALKPKGWKGDDPMAVESFADFMPEGLL